MTSVPWEFILQVLPDDCSAVVEAFWCHAVLLLMLEPIVGR